MVGVGDVVRVEEAQVGSGATRVGQSVHDREDGVRLSNSFRGQHTLYIYQCSHSQPSRI